MEQDQLPSEDNQLKEQSRENFRKSMMIKADLI